MRKDLLLTLATLGAAALMLATPARADEGEDPAALLHAAEQLYHRGEWSEALKAYEKAYTKTPKTSAYKAEAALGWSSLLWQQGDYKKASKRIDQALGLAEALKLDSAIGRLLLTKGQIEASRGQLRSAEDTLAICIKSAREQGDQAFAALCAINRRLVRQLRGRPAGPLSDYQAAIAQLKAAGTPLSVGSSLSRTAGFYEKNGDPDRALALLKEAQAQFDRAESVPAKLRNRLHIAKVLQNQGRHADARPYLAGKIARFQAMKNRPALIDALALSAADARARGQQDEAARLLAQALGVAKQTGSPTLIARGHMALCELEQPTESAGAALSQASIAHCEAAARGFQSLNMPTLAARSQAQLAKLYHGAGDLNKASTYYSRAIQTLETVRVPGSPDAPGIGETRANLCQVNMTLDTKGASFLCRKALTELQAQRDVDPAMLAATQYAAGVTAGRDGSAARGLENLEQAATLAQKLSPPNFRLAADAHLRRGMIYARTRQPKEAAQAFEKGISLAHAAKSPADPLAAVGVQLRTQLAQLQLKQEDWKGAQRTLDALTQAPAADTSTQAWAYSALARAALKQGDKPGAKEALKRGLPLAKKSGDTDLLKNFEENLKNFD